MESLVVWGHCHRSARRSISGRGVPCSMLWPRGDGHTLAGLEALTALSPSLYSIAGNAVLAKRSEVDEGRFWPVAKLPIGRDPSSTSDESSDGAGHESSYEAAAGNGETSCWRSVSSNSLRRISSSRPLVLVMEDAHWADTASIELLAMTASSLSSHPVAFVVTFRQRALGRFRYQVGAAVAGPAPGHDAIRARRTSTSTPPPRSSN